MKKKSSINTSSRLKTTKQGLDKILPLMLAFLITYLYVEVFNPSNNILQSSKLYLQITILIYFLLDLLVIFLQYEDNKKFFRKHWLDIILTVPFITALKGLKVFKFAKISKILKTSKLGKTLKISQKLGKLVKKLKKQAKNYRAN